MKFIKQLIVLLMAGAVGALAIWLIFSIYGKETAGAILAWGSVLFTLSMGVLRYLAEADKGAAELAAFDQLSRRNYLTAISLLRRKVKLRLIFGLLCGVVCMTTGIILSTSTNPVGFDHIALLGGACFAIGLVMLATMILGAFLVNECRRELLRVLTQEEKHRTKIANYMGSTSSNFEERPLF